MVSIRAIVSFGGLLALGIAAVSAEAPKSSDWWLLGNSHELQFHSDLTAINRSNVPQLGLAWVVDMPTIDGLVGNPLVKDGLVFQSGALGNVFANDLRTGKAVWKFSPEHDFEKMSFVALWGSRVNRGLALTDDLVIVASDCKLIALDQKTGKRRWEAQSCDPTDTYAITAAPRVGGGLVFTGNACMDTGETRGYVDAFDEKTGHHEWRFYTVPADPAKPQDAVYTKIEKTWGEGWYSKTRGCGSVWEAIAYDPVLDQLYVGVDAASPVSPKERGKNAGDELFTASVVALKARTGAYVWHFKEVPQDGWNYTPIGMMVADVPLHGKVRRVVLNANKNGFVYMLDARTGKFLKGRAYMDLNWAKGLTADGRPIVDPKAQYWNQPDQTTVVYPSGNNGGHGWEPMAYNPSEHLLYIPYSFNPTSIIGIDPKAIVGGVVVDFYVGPAYGGLAAWNLVTGSLQWEHKDDRAVMNSGVVSTAGGLVFQGTADGRFEALDASNGKALWSANVGGAVRAAPSTVMVDGDQYVLVASGNGSSSATGSFLSKYTTTPTSRSQARLMAFRIGGTAPYPKPPSPIEVPRPNHARFETNLAADGKRVFENSGCVECHGLMGDSVGGTVPNLLQKPPDPAMLKYAVHGGFIKSGMPSFGDMTDESIDALYAYLIDEGWNAYERQSRGDPSRH